MRLLERHTTLPPGGRAFVAGAAGAVGSSFVKVPAAVCIRSVQANIYPNVIAAATCITRAAGMRGLYTGYLPTVLEDVPDMAVKFAAYESMRAAHERIAKLPFDEPSGSVALMPLHFAARYACDAGVPDDAEAAANFREYRRFLAIRAVLPPLPLAMAGAAARAEVYLKFSSTAAEGYIPDEYVFPGDATQADILTAYYACQQCAVRCSPAHNTPQLATHAHTRGARPLIQ
jgi:hypothetical protein